MRSDECPICSAPGRVVTSFDASVTSESKVLPCSSVLFACDGCGHLFTSLDVDLRDYYATAYDATLTDEGQDELVVTDAGTTAFRTDVDYALFRRMVGDRLQPGCAVFEYGCGRGRILSRLRKDGVLDLRGHDVSESYRAPVEAMIGAGRVSIGERPAMRDVDVACTFFVLEHDPRPGDALRYLRATLKEDGLLYAMVPSYTTNLGDLACADHVNHFSPRSLRALLARSGFETLGVDDTSAVGSVAVVARPGPVVLEPGPSGPEARDASAAIAGYLTRLDAVVRHLDPARPIYLYGAGFYGALTLARLRGSGREAAGLFDANPRKQGEHRLGLRVAAPDSLSQREYGQAALVVCVNARVAGAIVDRFTPVFGSVLVA